MDALSLRARLNVDDDVFEEGGLEDSRQVVRMEEGELLGAEVGAVGEVKSENIVP